MLGSASTSSGGEETRGLLQLRVALFWKVMFIVNLISFALGSVGAMAEPGWDHLLNLLSVLQTGALWWWCRRGKRSVSVSYWADAGGLWVNATMGAFMARYFAGQFAVGQSIATPEEAALADGFISMIVLGSSVYSVHCVNSLHSGSNLRPLDPQDNGLGVVQGFRGVGGTWWTALWGCKVVQGHAGRAGLPKTNHGSRRPVPLPWPPETVRVAPEGRWRVAAQLIGAARFQHPLDVSWVTRAQLEDAPPAYTSCYGAPLETREVLR
jgi:hypothetical protein